MVLPWLPLFTVFFSGMIFLASFGKSLGVRKAYVRILLKVFEVRKQCGARHLRQDQRYLFFQFAQRIAKEERKKRRKSSDMDPLEYDDDDAKGDVGGEENNKNVSLGSQYWQQYCSHAASLQNATQLDLSVLLRMHPRTHFALYNPDVRTVTVLALVIRLSPLEGEPRPLCEGCTHVCPGPPL